MKNFNKKKNLEYICIVISSLFALMLISQNCASKNGTGVFYQTPGLTLKSPMIFKFKHKDTHTVSNILWQVTMHHYTKQDIGCYIKSHKKINFKKTDLNIEVDQNDILQADSTFGISIFAQTFIQFEEEDCITYRKKSLQLATPSNSNKADLICIQPAVLPPHINPTSSMDPTSPYMIEGIDNALYHFPVGDSISLELVNLRAAHSQFTWSIKNMENDTELADPTHQDLTLTHTFSEKGIYNVSATETNTNFEINAQLLIGQCEITNITEEIVMDTESSQSN